MKIEINLKIIIVLILSFLLKNLNTYVVFLFFIIIHEIAHLVFGIAIGGKPRIIKLEPFGMALDFYKYRSNNHIFNILFYFIGPFVNILIALLFIKYNIFNIDSRDKIIYINVLIFVFNLLPVIPLDGGKIMIEILNLFFNESKSNKIVFVVGEMFLYLITFTYSLLIIKIKNIFVLFLIIYLWYLFFTEKKKVILYEKTKKVIDIID